MPNPLTPYVASQKNALRSGDVEVLAYEIEVPTSPPTRLRFVVHDDEILWRGNTYYRAPISETETTQDAEGNLPYIELQMPNAGYEMAAILNLYNGLIGQPVRLLLLSLSDLSSNQPILQTDANIADVDETSKGVRIRLEAFNPRRISLPGGPISRLSCWYKFRGVRCGFSLPESITGAVTCDHSYDGDNGCTAKDDLYTAASVDQTQSDRFGGFRSVPRGTSGGGI
jgi:phage-related protein